LHYGEETLKLYTLHAWVIMCNHVHVLIEPAVPIARITRSIKTYTSHQANAILGRTGQPFWAEESYDRWIRAERDLEKVVQYIEGNPVAVDLCERPEDWPWSSAWTGQEACPTKSEVTT
jgi:putative transposase